MSQADVSVKTRVQVKQPSLYKVVLINDDHTPMDFVIQVLIQIFGFNEAKAHEITMQVHNDGKGVCGVFSKEVAETKVMEVRLAAQNFHYPLLAVAEKE